MIREIQQSRQIAACLASGPLASGQLPAAEALPVRMFCQSASTAPCRIRLVVVPPTRSTETMATTQKVDSQNNERNMKSNAKFSLQTTKQLMILNGSRSLITFNPSGLQTGKMSGEKQTNDSSSIGLTKYHTITEGHNNQSQGWTPKPICTPISTHHFWSDYRICFS